MTLLRGKAVPVCDFGCRRFLEDEQAEKMTRPC